MHSAVILGFETFNMGFSEMSRDVRKLVFGVSDPVKHKSGYAVTEESKNLEILDIHVGKGGIALVLSE